MNWLKAHPIKAVSFTLLFTFIGTFAGCRADLFVPLLVAFLLALFMFVLVFSIDAHKIIVSLLAFLMVLAPCRPPAVSASQKKGGEVVVAVVIICGMTYCVYRLEL